MNKRLAAGFNEPRMSVGALDHVQMRMNFDPVEANFISTVLKDCYYQLHNVGTSEEVKPLRLPQLFKAENRSLKAPVGNVANMSKKKSFGKFNYENYEKISTVDNEPRSTTETSRSNLNQKISAISSFRQGLNSELPQDNSEDNSLWVERLVEAHGLLESSYLTTVDQARSLFGTQKSSQGKPIINLEDHGIRMKSFELSKAIADHENALSQIVKHRNTIIIDGLKDVILATADELREKGTYESLKMRNQLERTALENGPKIVIQEMQYQEKCKQLINSIIDEKEQGQRMIKEREAQVASLKDYLKEQKVLRAYEMAYIKNFSEASLEQLKKMNEKKIFEVEEEERRLQQLVDNDIKANEVMESFLKKEIESYQELLNWWTIKYDTDIEKKTAELKELKERREKDLEWQETLKKRIIEYEQVIEDDRRVKAIKQAEEDLLKLQIKKAIQIQAWWRGLRVRRCLGPFKKKKQKKKKDGKSGGGKK